MEFMDIEIFIKDLKASGIDVNKKKGCTIAVF